MVVAAGTVTVAWDPKARTPNELAEQNLAIVDHVVGQLAVRFPTYADRDELRAAGAVGLVDAAHRYDPDTGVPFARYASIRVRGAVLDATRSLDWVPRRARRAVRELDEATQRFAAELHRDPSDEEIAAELGVNAAEVRERRSTRLGGALLALDRPVGTPDGEVACLGELVVEDDEAWLPDAALLRGEVAGTLHAAIALLPQELRDVLIAHHFAGSSVRDVADEFGVSEARVSQLHLEALRALQAYFATTYEEVTPPPEDAPGKRRRAVFVGRVAANTTWRSRVDAYRWSGGGICEQSRPVPGVC